MSRAKSKQLISLNANKVIEDPAAQFMNAAEAVLLSDLVSKGSYGVKVFTTSLSLASTQIATRDIRTASTVFTFPTALSAVPVGAIGVITNDFGSFTINITAITATNLTYRINNPISTTTRTYNIKFIVFY